MGRERPGVFGSCVAGGEGNSGENVKVLCIERSSYKKVVAMEICRTLQRVSAFEGFPPSQLRRLRCMPCRSLLRFIPTSFSETKPSMSPVERGEFRLKLRPAPGHQDASLGCSENRPKTREEVYQQLPESQIEKGTSARAQGGPPRRRGVQRGRTGAAGFRRTSSTSSSCERPTRKSNGSKL